MVASFFFSFGGTVGGDMFGNHNAYADFLAHTTRNENAGELLYKAVVVFLFFPKCPMT